MGSRILALAVLALSVTACDVAKTAKETKGIAKESNERIARAEHNGTLLEMKRELFDEGNNAVLDPVPFNMLPAGKRLAQHLTADEWAEFATLLLSEIMEDRSLGNRTAEEFDHYKRIRVATLSIVSGFLPQTTFDEILRRHVHGASGYKSAGLAIVVFRALFLHDTLIRNAILEKNINSSGQVADAIDRADKLDRIARLPFVAHIKVNLNTFANPELNRTLAFDPALAAQVWVELQRKALRYDPSSAANWQSDKASAEQKVAEEVRLMNQYNAIIESRIQEWGVERR